MSSIEKNAKHYIDIVSRAVDKCLPEPSENTNFKSDVLDILYEQRRQRTDMTEMAVSEGREGELQVPPAIFPAELLRRYD